MKYISISTKLFVVMCGLAVAASGITIELLNSAGQTALRDEVRTNIASMAGTAAAAVDGDTVTRLTNSTSPSSEDYSQIVSVLKEIRKARQDVQRLFIIKRTADRNKLALVLVENSHASNDQATIVNRPSIQNAFSGPVSEDLIESRNSGRMISGYAPVYDSRGRIVAIMGMDVSVEELAAHENSIVAAAAFSLIIALILVLMLGHVLANRLTLPVRTLTTAARRVADDDLEHQVDINSNDEIGELANTFNKMIEAVKTVRARLVERANTDALTDLFNHRYFHERLAAEVSRAGRYGHKLCLIIIDVDHFKALNDTFGHPAGDFILTSIASIMRGVVRDIDIVARYGGDEFAVIMPETERSVALNYAEQIRTRVEQEEFDYGIGEALRTSLSLGIAEFPTHHCKTDGLIMAADIALFRAKHTSRNRTITYEPIAKGDTPIDPYELHKLLHDPNVTAIETLAAAVDARDRYTHGHSERVTEYAVRIAGELGVTGDDLETVKIAGLMHDVGKIGVPDSILNKPGPLSDDERRLIQNHPALGAKIVSRAPQLENILPGILHHHERFDGSGYPEGLQGEDIPRVARILAVADAYDAMTSKRPYRNSLPISLALDELRKYSGIQFDPEVVDAFLRILGQQGSQIAA